VAGEDFTFAEAALQVVEPFCPSVHRRAVCHVGDSKTLHFLARTRTAYERQTAARPHIVHRLEEGEQQIGGIIIPDTAKEKPQQGTVIAVGNGKANDNGKRIPLDVKAGDRILFGKYSGQEIKLDGEEYLIVKEDEVLAVIEDRTEKKSAVIKGQTQKKTKKTTTKSKK
jgi:chaperonin GroES